jgi:tetratricopeptide (TPR) repeat protein
MNRYIERHWQRACDYLHNQQLQAAQTQLESMLHLAHDDPRTQLLAARIAWSRDLVRDAVAYAVNAEIPFPQELGLLCHRIETLLQVGETALAHELLKQPVWQDVTDSELLLRYANCLQELGEHFEPVLLHRIAELSTDNAALCCFRGQELAAFGRREEAEVAYLQSRLPRNCLDRTFPDGEVTRWRTRWRYGRSTWRRAGPAGCRRRRFAASADCRTRSSCTGSGDWARGRRDGCRCGSLRRRRCVSVRRPHLLFPRLG